MSLKLGEMFLEVLFFVIAFPQKSSTLKLPSRLSLTLLRMCRFVLINSWHSENSTLLINYNVYFTISSGGKACSMASLVYDLIM